MKIEGPLIQGKFVERPNRFITMVEVDGKIVRSHLPDPGRLKELLLPGAKLLLRPAPEGSERKTKYSTVMLYHEGQLISLVSVLPNRFVLEALQDNLLPMFHNYGFVRSEVSHGNHRFDFLLKGQNENPFYLEVKSVTYVENGLAKFPDAVTERGRRHVKHLANLRKKDLDVMILFVVQRPDVECFQPEWERDPKFGFALVKAQQNGLEVRVIHLKMTKTELQYLGELPAKLNPES